MSDEKKPPKPKRSPLKWLLHLVLLSSVALVLILVYRGYRLENRQLSVPAAAPPKLDWAAANERLAGAVRIRTISPSSNAQSVEAREAAPAFKALHAYLARSFPKFHAAAEREVVASLSLLFSLKGTDPSLEPVAIVGHLDVAPITKGTLLSWTEKPFSGAIKQDKIWGRGTLDDKSFVLGLLEALEHLLQAGFSPKRGLYIALSHDQMRGGERGSQALSAELAKRANRFRVVFTEGLAVLDGFVPEIAAPIALVGVGEKGQATLLLEGADGDRSKLEAAQKRLMASPMPAEFSGPAVHQFEYLAHEFPFAIRLAVANRWLFSGLLEDRISESPGSDALVRTLATGTTVPPGFDDSGLPPNPVVVNYRLRPGDPLKALMAHAEQVVEDPQIKLRLLEGAYAVPPSAEIDPAELGRLQRVIEGVFPEAVFAPSLVVGATDARHFAGLSTNVYRFRPLKLAADDMSRSRNSDERIEVEDYKRVVTFCAELVKAYTQD